VRYLCEQLRIALALVLALDCALDTSVSGFFVDILVDAAVCVYGVSGVEDDDACEAPCALPDEASVVRGGGGCYSHKKISLLMAMVILKH
jgi:hypothetical protein